MGARRQDFSPIPKAGSDCFLFHVPATATRRATTESTQQPQVADEMKIGLEILKEVPHLLHMTFISQSANTIFKLWGAVQPDYLTISSQDLVMKYGAVLDGLWTVRRHS